MHGLQRPDPQRPMIRDAVSALLEEAAALPGIAMEPLAALRRKVEARNFNLVVAGEFKRGKSSLINALVGIELLPTAAVPLTSIVTHVRYGEAPRAELVFDSGETREVTLDRLPDFVTERGNPRNAKRVREVSVACPATWLADGLRIVDTPGIGSIHEHNTEVTRRFLPEADAVILVFSVDQPLSRNELEFLIAIRRNAGKVFCLLNKIDHLAEVEVSESVAFVEQLVEEALAEPTRVFPVSARLALQGRLANDSALIARSGLAAFDQVLQRFLVEERRAVWHRSVRQHLLRLIDETHLSIELELRALALPAKLLDEKLRAFADKKIESLQARADFDALLEADSRRLIKDRVEPDLDVFKKALLLELDEKLTAWHEELRALGSRALQARLEERLIARVRSSFDAWRGDEDRAVGAAFDALCARFWDRTEETVNQLLRFSAELFAVPFAIGSVESLWRDRPRFQYKFWSEPPSLLMMRNALVLALPRVVGHRLILRDGRRRAAHLVEMHAGRLRYDFEERIKKNIKDFRRELLERVEATIEGLQIAIEKGSALRGEGELRTRDHQDRLTSALTDVAALRNRVASGM